MAIYRNMYIQTYNTEAKVLINTAKYATTMQKRSVANKTAVATTEDKGVGIYRGETDTTENP